MIRLRLPAACSVIALLLAMQAGAAAGFRVNDYAYGATLNIDGQAALYTVPLSEDVYRHTTHADLSDLCVVNALNEIVPFAVHRSEPAPDAPRTFSSLTLFPIRGPDGIPSEALKLKLQAGQTSLALEQPGLTATNIAVAYLVDARAVAERVTALRLSWPESTSDFSAQLIVEQSTDLVNWVSVTGGAPIVNLHFNGQTFVRNEVVLPGAYRTVLRLRWLGQPPAVSLDGVSGGASVAQPEYPRQVMRVVGRPGKEFGVYEFDLGVRLPVDRLSLDLPESNTVVTAAFYAQPSDTDDFQSITHGRLYRLHAPDTADLTNGPLSVPVTVARRWKVKIEPSGGGLGNGLPTLVAGVLPEDLLFIARGQGPFRMLYGNSTATPLAVSARALLENTTDGNPSESAIQARPASVEAPVLLGGEGRLVPVASGLDKKRWFLWIVLLLGVGTMGLMTWKLSRTL